MKTNSTVKRLGAFILAGSIAALSAFAADSTTPSAPSTTGSVSTQQPATASTDSTKAEPNKKHSRKHHRRHHQTAAVNKSEQSKAAGKNRTVALGVIAKNSQMGEKAIHPGLKEVKLTQVFRGSPAAKAGLRPGDVIWKFDGQRVTSVSQIKRELRSEKRGSTVPVEVYRHGKREEFQVKIGAA